MDAPLICSLPGYFPGVAETMNKAPHISALACHACQKNLDKKMPYGHDLKNLQSLNCMNEMKNIIAVNNLLLVLIVLVVGVVARCEECG
jgi:hypothetical protein